MPAYSAKELARAKEEIALERVHICNNCGTKMRLSHSHLIPASRAGSLYTVKENIVFHCLSLGDTIGCHSKWESVECVLMKDFESNFELIFKLDRQYFWLRLEKLDTIWQRRDRNVWLKIRAFYKKMDDIEQHEKRKENEN